MLFKDHTPIARHELGQFPSLIETEEDLDALLSTPSLALVNLMKRLAGDIIILGVAGKMGLTLGAMANRAIELAGVQKRVYGVARFSTPGSREKAEAFGMSAISCDLLDADAVARLPQAPNVLFMAGRKFGTQGQEAVTWAMNTLVPGFIAAHYAQSRIVAFSTGCVYPLVEVGQSCDEHVPPAPVGDYAQSCLGRERIFSYYSQRNGTPVCLLRLNYAAELRYGVIHDIATQVWTEQPVELTVGYYNVIWQGDANAQALLALEHCASPAAILNVTGPETISVRSTATMLGALMEKSVTFTGQEGPANYLNDATRASRLFGYPAVPFGQLLRWNAHWVMSGGRSLGKPTKFEVSKGQF